MDVDQRLAELGIELPNPMRPGGNYVPPWLPGIGCSCPGWGQSGRTAAW